MTVQQLRELEEQTNSSLDVKTSTKDLDRRWACDKEEVYMKKPQLNSEQQGLVNDSTFTNAPTNQILF